MIASIAFWSFVSLHITHRPHPDVNCSNVFCLGDKGRVTYHPGCRNAIVRYPSIRSRGRGQGKIWVVSYGEFDGRFCPALNISGNTPRPSAEPTKWDISDKTISFP